METLRLLQLDFVNVLVPAHYLVVWSRLGAYDPNRLHRFLYHTGQYVEHWAHEASIVPADYWPVLAYRRRDYRPWPRSPVNELADLDDYGAVNEEYATYFSDIPPARVCVEVARIPRDALVEISMIAIEGSG